MAAGTGKMMMMMMMMTKNCNYSAFTSRV